MIRALSLYREKLEKKSRPKQFMTLKNLYEGAEYVLGEENLERCDCSGLVCGILTLLGNKIRINADNIKDILCIEDNKYYDDLKVKLVFFLNEEGVAKHVGILSPNNLIYHASYPNGTRYESLPPTVERYKKKGLEMKVMMLNFDAVDSNTGLVYDLDSELS